MTDGCFYFKIYVGDESCCIIILSFYKGIKLIIALRKQYPYGVISGHTAYYYGFTDIVPLKIILCTNRNSTIIKNNEIKQIRMKDELYSLGITEIEYDGVFIRIYDRERLLIDFARNKNNMGYDLYKEIVAQYRSIVSSLEMWKIDEYLAHFSDVSRIYEILMNEVF